MKNPATSFGRYLRAAIFFVLLAAQGITAAHEYTHLDGSAQELCATCSISSGLDISIALHAPVLRDAEALEFRFECAGQILYQGAPNCYLQRAPPVYL